MSESTHTRSSEKRKLEVQWDEVVSQLSLEPEFKDTLIADFTRSQVTPATFLTYSSFHKEALCQRAGVEGY